MFLRQSTAVDILLGPFVDETDGKSAETGLTLDVEVSKNGQALANKNDSTTPTHDAAGSVDGYYNCELDATDTNTVGQLMVVAHASGALPVWQYCQIVEEVVYDALFASGATGAFTGVSVNALTTAALTDVWATDTLTEAYAADGAAATPAQLLYMLWAGVNEFSISGDTITAKKLDGSTTAMTWTLDDSSSPTSRTRAT